MYCFHGDGHILVRIQFRGLQSSVGSGFAAVSINQNQKSRKNASYEETLQSDRNHDMVGDSSVRCRRGHLVLDILQETKGSVSQVRQEDEETQR